MTATESAPRLSALWLAARPSQLALIGLVYVLGVGTARVLEPTVTLPWVSAGVGLGALVPVAAAVHYANEYADAATDRLTARTPFSGGSGALVRTGVERSLLARASGGSLVGGAAVTAVGWRAGHLSATAVGLLAAIGVAGLLYSLPPVALIRRGVGEVTNALLGGSILPLYGVAVVGRPSITAALSVVPFTLLVGCNLLATHWPDREADAAVGKLTLAVRWSPRGLRRAYWTLAVLAVVVTAGLAGQVLPFTVVAAQALALPPLLWGGVVLTRQRSPFPAVAAMVVHAGASTVAWWLLALS